MVSRQLQNEYLDVHFPKDLSPEIIEYAREVVFKTSRYIFTRRLGWSQYGFCTHCRQEFLTDGLRHNQTTFCPECLSGCIVKAGGMGRKRMIDKAYFVYYQKSIEDPQVIIAMGIYAVRDYRNDYENVITKFKIIAQYVFAKGGSAMRSRYVYYMHDGRIDVGDWKRAYNVHSLFTKDHISHIPSFVSHESIAAAVKDTPFQYSTWESYAFKHNKDLTEFFDLYAKYPCIEYLTKLGFEGLVQAKLNGYPTYSAINWRGKDLFKVLKLSKQEINEIKQRKINIDFYFLKVLQTSKKLRYGLSIPEIIKLLACWSSYDFDELQKLAKYGSIKRISGYLHQQLNYDHRQPMKHFYNNSGVLTTFRDYIADCLKLGLDLTQEVILFPKNLYQAHQETNKRVLIKNDPETNRKIIARAKNLQKYYFEYQGLLIRPARSYEELINEGNALEHCVATHYAEKHANGETNILFIRKISDPDKPYFTVELRGNLIIQVHGFANCDPDERVKAFLDAFKSEKLDTSKRQALKTA